MTDEAMKADNHEPDYRKAMLFHSDRADQYAAERDAVVAKAATLRAEVEKLRGELDYASKKWITHMKQAAKEQDRAGKAEAEVSALQAEIVAIKEREEKLRGALQIARVHVANNAEGWSVSRGAARDDLTIVDAALAPTDAAQVRPAWLSNCVVCGRIVDTRETDEGGDGHGCEYPEGWTCSSDCAETLHPDPDWMQEGLAAQAREAALREAAAKATEHMNMHNGSDMNSYRATLGVRDAILALIGEART